MREIKFRVWHKNAKRFLKSCDCGPDETYWFGMIDNPLKVCEMYCSEFVDYCKPVEIQQFTGLKDKNGVEIYEGDILYCVDDFADDQHSAFFTVIWDKYRWAFQMKGDEKYGGGHGWLEVNKDCKVSGNIFENPELLEK